MTSGFDAPDRQSYAQERTPMSMKSINRCMMTGIDRCYGVISRKKTCSKLKPMGLFDGREYSIDPFYEESSSFLEKPWDFCRDFKENGCKCHRNHSLLVLKP